MKCPPKEDEGLLIQFCYYLSWIEQPMMFARFNILSGFVAPSLRTASLDVLDHDAAWIHIRNLDHPRPEVRAHGARVEAVRTQRQIDTRERDRRRATETMAFFDSEWRFDADGKHVMQHGEAQ